MSIPATTNRSSLHKDIANRIDTAIRPLHEWEGELMTEEEKRLAERVSILRGLLPPFVCAIYNGQAHDWDRETVLSMLTVSMLTGGDGLDGEDPPARLTEDDVRAYIDKLLA